MTTTTLQDTLTQTFPHLSGDAIARGILSALAEPNDSDLGTVTARLGAQATLAAISHGDFEGSGRSDLDDLIARLRPRFDEQQIRSAFTTAADIGATLVTPEHADWPTRMNDLGDAAPVALWVRGDSSILSDGPTMAVVGARASTGYGEHVTVEIVAGLADRGYTIASGAAYGIDGAAHRSALGSGARTIAYLAGGVDRFYPSGHDILLSRIVEHGAVVSEVPCGAAPTRWRFLARNRLIAANSHATLVTEAGWRSGSLNTAGHALALGRPVGAVPGPVTSATSAGCARLIRDHNATLVTSAEEAAEL